MSSVVQPTSLDAKLRQARTDLLDLTLRNNMLNFRLPKKQGLNILPQPIDELFTRLVRQHEAFRFFSTVNTSTHRLDEENESDGSIQSDTISIEERETVASEESESITTDDTAKETTGALVLSTPYTADALQDRLLQTFRTARSYIEEQGANTFFLAFGFLEWYEADSSDKPLYAPLLLVPVQLERDTVRERFTLKYTDEEVMENLSLVHRMKLDFRLDLPSVEFEDSDNFSMSDYMTAVRQCVATRKRWTVHPDKLVLAFFSFGKYLMFHDLDADQWPEASSPLKHEILSALLGEGFQEAPSNIDPNARLDDILPLDDIRTVLDADSSQLTAVVDISRGRNLVIQGPPGTGKSQTITNVIARAVMDGKSVLFVAEKMAALEVVKSRLEQIGLGSACLELHSNKTNKRQLLLEVDRTWQLRGEASAGAGVEDREYEMQRKKLNEYTDAVHQQMGHSGVTPYYAMGTLVQQEKQAKDEYWPVFEVNTEWSHEQFVEFRALLSDLQALLCEIGVPEKHPFWGCELTEIPAGAENERLLAHVRESMAAVESFQSAWEDTIEQLSVDFSHSWADVERSLELLRRLEGAPSVTGVNTESEDWTTKASLLRDMAKSMQHIDELRAKHEDALLPDTWKKDLSQVRAHLIAHQSSMFRFLSSEYKSARVYALSCLRRPDKQGSAQILEWLGDVIEVRVTIDKVMQQASLLSELLGTLWRTEESEWSVCSRVIEWMAEVHEDVSKAKLPAFILDLLLRPNVQEVAKEHASRLQELLERAKSTVSEVSKKLHVLGPQPLTALGSSVGDVIRRLQSWHTNMDKLVGIVRWNLYAERCRRAGLQSVPILASHWEHASVSLIDAFAYRFYEALLQKVFKLHPNLAEFAGSAQWSTVERFRALDGAMTKATQSMAVRAHVNRMPTREANGGELSVLRREILKKARHMPIRRLLENAGHAIQGIKPVFMASPLSVATFIPPGSLHFDLVVFDEASQVLPTDAFGAILRGRQLVVVGDSKQLPPTNFFDAALDDEDEEDEDTGVRTSDMESILGLCASQGMPERMLRWHYRSRHESLVAVSNAEFYDGRLVVFPSPERMSESTGLVLHHLENTAYDRGKSRTNRQEARAVAEAVMRHAKAYVAGETNHTLGVVAFSSAQAGAIEDEVDRLRRQSPGTEAFFSGLAEKFFVKNLETVQGDERDIILISVGYGRDKDGYLAMSFGPLGKAGGERRLNVLITRARVRCEVFTNLRADDIDLHRAKGEGIRVFKEFLRYCETGLLDMPHTSEREMDSPFEEAVRDELVSLGYEVDTQVGSAGFFVDLAVVDPDTPGRYLLGIECDGRTYHSSRSARDRDRLRQQVLEGLGWKLHRIWSTDWFRDRRKALEKVVTAIEKTKKSGPGMGANRESRFNGGTKLATDSRSGEGNEAGAASGMTKEAKDGASLSVPYTSCELVVAGLIPELHEVPASVMANWIRRVVEVEAPVHMDVVVRRIVEACGVKRVGRRIRATYESAVSTAVREKLVERRGEFLYRVSENGVPLRDRSDLAGIEKRMNWIASEEIAGMILALIERAYGYTEDDLITDTCRQLGFQRVTQDMREVVEPVISRLRKEGEIRLEGMNYVKGR